MNGNGERPGIDPSSAEAAVGGRPTLPGIRRIATLAIVGGSSYIRPEGSDTFHPVRQLGGGSREVREAPRPERFHETLVFDGLNPVGIPGVNGGIE